MIGQFRKIYDLLDAHERRRGALVLALILVMGLVETVGVASVMPFMAVVANPGVIEENPYLSRVYIQLGFSEPSQFLLFLGGAVLVILVGSLLFSAFTNAFLFRFTQMCNYRLSTRLLEAYFYRPYAWFLGQHSADLGKTVLGEVNQLVAQVILPALNLISRSIVSAFLLLLVLLVDPVVAVVAAALLGGIYALIFLSLRRYLVRIGTDMYDANTERFKIAQEGLGGIKDVKVSGLESAYVRRYHDPARRFSRRQAAQMIISEIPRYLLEALAFGGVLGILLVLMLTRPGGLGEVLPLIAVYVFAGYRLLPALQQVYFNASYLKFGSRVLDRLHMELVESASDRELSIDSVHPSAAMRLDDRLVLDAVSYRYPGAQANALDQVSVEIRAHTAVGFVGATGAGKTTAVDVIIGLLEPDSGQLVVDGIAITRENRRRWQRSVGYVPQHIFLVDDTVAANIAFGEDADAIDLKGVERAARVARLHDFIITELPQGYATTVGDRGVRLSGGQRQRIGIARALYHDPSVLVLDEATSALDNVTEREVMEEVRTLGQAKTVIMIAHRLSTVKACDTIFVFDQGKVVATGTYEQLTNSSPVFQRMAQYID